MSRLEHKTCLITGAARGIGRAIANRFREEGASVIVTDIDEPTVLRSPVKSGHGSSSSMSPTKPTGAASHNRCRPWMCW